MRQRYNKGSHELYKRAVTKFLTGKWRRSAVLVMVEKYAGIPRKYILDAIKRKDLAELKELKEEAIEAITEETENLIAEIKEGRRPEEIEDVQIRRRYDGSCRKERDIAKLSNFHQIINHVIYEELKPLLNARIEPTQHASIPGRGQTGLKRQVSHYLRSELPIRYFREAGCSERLSVA